MIQKPHGVWRKKQLLEEHWQGIQVHDQAVTHCIKELRGLLGDNPTAPRFIKTLPKRGYVWICPVSLVSPPLMEGESEIKKMAMPKRIQFWVPLAVVLAIVMAVFYFQSLKPANDPEIHAWREQAETSALRNARQQPEVLGSSITLTVSEPGMGEVTARSAALAELASVQLTADRLHPDLIQALAHTRKVIDQKPDSAEAYLALSRVQGVLGRYHKAIAFLKAALFRDPENLECHLELAEYLNRIGKKKQSLEYLIQALKQFPDEARIHFQLGNLFFYLGQIKFASQYYRKALELNPGNSLYRKKWVRSHFYLKDGDQNPLAMNRDLAKDYPLAAAGNFLLVGALGEARQALERTLHKDLIREMNPYASKMWGYLLVHEGRLEEAEARLNAALSFYLNEYHHKNEDLRPAYHIATIYAVKNQPQEACRWLETALGMGWSGFLDFKKPHWDPVREEGCFGHLLIRTKQETQRLWKRVQPLLAELNQESGI